MKKSILQTRFAIQKVHPDVGQGLFATECIKKGVFVLEYTGKKVPTKRADKMKGRYLFEIDRKWTIDGSSRANLARYINHSCSPNCEATIKKKENFGVCAPRYRERRGAYNRLRQRIF